MASGFWRCYNEKCRPVNGTLTEGLEFHADDPTCPSCKAHLRVLRCVHVHWLVATGGPIMTADGPGHVACMPDRNHLMQIHATGEASAVTCPKCKEAEAALHTTKLAEYRESNGIILAKG